MIREIGVKLRELRNVGQNLPEHLYVDAIEEITKMVTEALSQEKAQDEAPDLRTPRTDRFGNFKLLEKIITVSADGRPQEPFFLLRGSDPFAPYLVRQWADLADAANVPQAKVVNARQCARAMSNWPTKKIPD